MIMVKQQQELTKQQQDKQKELVSMMSQANLEMVKSCKQREDKEKKTCLDRELKQNIQMGEDDSKYEEWKGKTMEYLLSGSVKFGPNLKAAEEALQLIKSTDVETL